jgi:20S proteasome alpha/beta subunit
MFPLKNNKTMTKEQALDVVEKAIDIAFERGKGRLHPNGVKYIRADEVDNKIKQAYEKGWKDGAQAASEGNIW